MGGRKSREGKGTSRERDRDPGVGGKGKTILQPTGLNARAVWGEGGVWRISLGPVRKTLECPAEGLLAVGSH